MKLRHAILVLLFAALLAACNFNLASDVTPPPDYIPPTPAPTLGPQFPANTPDLQNGASIYVEKCEPCHGAGGMGDGPQGKDLPVSVAALGLPATAQKAKPADWYIMVTQGKLDRFMPPFASLNDQERWDVVSYALTLHTTPDQIAQGRSLFETNCADCAGKFSSPEMMSSLSENDLVQVIKTGQGGLPAFGKNFSDQEAAAVAAYLRTMTYTASAEPTVVPATATPAPTEAAATPADGTPAATDAAGTPSAESTAVDGTPATVEATPAAGMGTISGSIDNQTGQPLPSGMKVTLRALEHGSDMNAGPKDIAKFEGTVNPDGTFVFENMEIPTSRIFIADVTVNGSVYQSGFVIVKDGDTSLEIPPVTIFEGTKDFSVLKIDSLDIHFDFAIEGTAQIFAIYKITNDTGKTISVTMPSAQEIPFVTFPAGAEALGFEATSDTAPYVQTSDGFAMPPSTKAYGLIAFSSIVKSEKIEISQTVLLPVTTISVFLPEGMDAQGDTLKDEGIRQEQGTNYHVYTAGGINQNESIKFTILGKPQGTSVNPNALQNKTLLIGVGALGLVLVLAGAWLFLRSPKPVKETEQDEDNLEDTESLMDAIIVLDDLHRTGKLSDEAYQKRRAELKNALKKKS